ncbi:MAG: protein-L-isoaspartate O-methyltransferase [Deltaproteobacteria bacterium RBG_16_49_23]|nr:MAG: protein-L-isoaspartate O-methyltransferase [Deltaproteobacteria bacterium RBG_16_49_23]
MDFSKVRLKMVEEQIAARGIKDSRVIAAIKKVPRHLFVEEALQSQAYSDHPLPIGEKQTISQPYMVALMTEAMELKGKERILEIGAGSGYQTAILAELAQEVFSVERIRSLAIRARKLLYELGYFNVEIKIFDGTYGWAEKSPFDAITVTAGSPDIPQPFYDQLSMGGRLVIPVGDADAQDLFRITKTEGGMKKENLGGCRFVKLIGRYGWEDEGIMNDEQ